MEQTRGPRVPRFPCLRPSTLVSWPSLLEVLWLGTFFLWVSSSWFVSGYFISFHYGFVILSEDSWFLHPEGTFYSVSSDVGFIVLFTLLLLSGTSIVITYSSAHVHHMLGKLSFLTSGLGRACSLRCCCTEPWLPPGLWLLTAGCHGASGSWGAISVMLELSDVFLLSAFGPESVPCSIKNMVPVLFYLNQLLSYT